MPRDKLKLTQNIFEARFDQGYRYLDRCGDAMILLEKGLPGITDDKVWMPEEMAPRGARIKCPALDVTLHFDAHRLCVDQNPVDVECPFDAISEYAFDTVVSKFAIQKITRLGNRVLHVLPSDSVEEADMLSLKKAPFANWLVSESNNIKPRSCNVATVLESEDRSKGVRFSISPTFTVEAPLQLDERLRKPPHTLPTGQREALLDQLRRRKQRSEAPVAGLLIDVDCWWLNPEKADVKTFFGFSAKHINELTNSFLGR